MDQYDVAEHKFGVRVGVEHVRPLRNNAPVTNWIRFKGKDYSFLGIMYGSDIYPCTFDGISCF